MATPGKSLAGCLITLAILVVLGCVGVKFLAPMVGASSSSSGTWTTTQTFTGNGIQKTNIFSVGSDWKILYSCTYQSVDGITTDGALAVYIYSSDDTLVDVAVDAVCKSGVDETTGQTEEHQGGQVYLNITGTGDWTVQVQEPK